MHLSPRCLARTRKGTACQNGAMPNGRCKFHGGMSTGAPTGPRNGNYRTGKYTKEAVAERRRFSALMRECRKQMNALREVE